MFDDSVTKKARVREIERNARQLTESITKLLDGDDGGQERGDHYHEDCEHCRRRMEAWRSQAREKWNQSRHMAKEKGEEIDAYARENVWKTVGIAAAVGAVLGSLLMKRRR